PVSPRCRHFCLSLDCHAALRALHSFPTRRSSDLRAHSRAAASRSPRILRAGPALEPGEPPCSFRSSSPRPSRPPLCNRSRESSRSEEHTSELQSHLNLVCRLLLEKKKIQQRVCTS